jgi:hypothetical protein
VTCHHPRTPPPEWETVLLLHWYDASASLEPLCETGYWTKHGGYCWHNPMHNTDGLEPQGWMPLPLCPEGPPK